MNTHHLPYAETLRCVQCSYCLPVCPTFQSTGVETQSPRGRINLVKLLAEGKINSAVLQNPIDLCLGCRACEDACPVGVPYGDILEKTRHALFTSESKSRRKMSRLQHWFYRKVLPNKHVLHIIGDLLWVFQKTLGQSDKMVSILPMPSHLREFVRITPILENPISRRRWHLNPSDSADQKKKALLFHGCIMDVMFHTVNRQTAQLLSHFGYRPEIPQTQTCCGALHAHAGDIEYTKTLAKQNILAFEQSGADIIVHNAGGCGAMLYEYGKLLADEPDWVERARKFSDAVRDISEIAKQAGPSKFEQPVEARVTYQASCHLHYVERVKTEPVDVLKSIPGVEYIEMQGHNACCGSAGIYNLVHYDESMEILDKKMEHARDTKASCIVTSNPGCFLQMKLGVRRSGLSHQVEVLHLVELLAKASGLAGEELS